MYFSSNEESRQKFYRVISDMYSKEKIPADLAKYIRVLGMEDRTVFNQIINYTSLNVEDKSILLNSLKEIIQERYFNKL